MLNTVLDARVTTATQKTSLAEDRSKFTVTVLGTKATQDDLESDVGTQEENQQVENV